MEVRKIRSKTIYQQVTDEIRSMIDSGDLKPGDRLPPLADLAGQFGVSRAAVREAITALQGMGLVDVRHGEGTFIRMISMEAIVDPFQAALLLGQSDLNQLLEVRHLLECGMAEFASMRRTPEDIHALSGALFEMETAAKWSDGVQAELKFHFLLAQATRNSVLINMMNALSEALKSLIALMWEDDTQHTLRQASMEDHRNLFDAIVSGDVLRAREHVSRHLHRMGDWMQGRRGTPNSVN